MRANIEDHIARFPTAPERFWGKVRKESPDRCWEWQAARRPDGYGLFSLGGATGHMYQAHRVAWVMTNGPIPPGQVVRHRCDNRPCVNPSHLELGDHNDNMRDMAVRERHGMTRLTAEKVRSMRARSTSGESYSKLAAAFDVSVSAVAYVIRRETWRHVQ